MILTKRPLIPSTAAPWRALVTVLLPLVLLGAAPGMSRADPNPLEGALGGGQVTTGAAPEELLSAGGAHTCALATDGTLACWGNNFYGQAPVPTLTPDTLPQGTVNIPYGPVTLALTATNYTRPPRPSPSRAPCRRA